MNKVFKWLLLPFTLIAGVFAGIMIRQPKINKLKKAVSTLQKQLATLQDKMIGYQKSFDNLLLQYKGLKVMQLKKKADMKGKIEENLILQYGMKAYINLLLDGVKNGKKLENNELLFYKSFDNVIEGKKIWQKDLENIKSFVVSKYRGKIQSLMPCECSAEFKKLEEYGAE